MVAQLHNWNLTPQEAVRLQTEFRDRLVLKWDGRPVRTIGGVDVSIQGEFTRAAIVVLRHPELTPIEAAVESTPLVFPYIPGLVGVYRGEQIDSFIILVCVPGVYLSGTPAKTTSWSAHRWPIGIRRSSKGSSAVS